MSRREQTKTDNAHLPAKLALRRHFLAKYHSEEATRPDVLDCCQGGGVIWKTLRRRHELAGYWGLDVKPRAGRLALDSVRVLSQPGWRQNVVDIDTYGVPWKHWHAMLPNVARPTTVYLTLGLVRIIGGAIDRQSLKVSGLDKLPSLSGPLANKVAHLYPGYHLSAAEDHGLAIVEAVEALVDSANIRYFGLHLVPKGQKSAK